MLDSVLLFCRKFPAPVLGPISFIQSMSRTQCFIRPTAHPKRSVLNSVCFFEFNKRTSISYAAVTLMNVCVRTTSLLGTLTFQNQSDVSCPLLYLLPISSWSWQWLNNLSESLCAKCVLYYLALPLIWRMSNLQWSLLQYKLTFNIL